MTDLAEQRADYAQTLVKAAAKVVTAVRDEGPQGVAAAVADATAVPAPHDVDPYVALATVLAAMVPDDVPLPRLLAWVDPTWRYTPTADVEVDPAVELAVLNDRPGRLSRTAAVEVVRRLAALGLSDRQIAEHVGCARRSVGRIRGRHDIPAGVRCTDTARRRDIA